MSFFSKPEYKEIILPFIYEISSDDLYAGLITIEAYGDVLGEYKYCYVSYFVGRKLLDEINEMADLLKNSYEKTVKVILKIKNGKVKDFKIDLNSLADAYNDNRFKSMEVSCWGLNDKSFKEVKAN